MAKDLDHKDVALHAKYRKEVKKSADEVEDKYFMFMGAIDSRTCPDCEKHLGIVYTEAELLKINPDVFKHGFCKQCRCSLSGLRSPDSVVATRYREVADKQRAQLADFRRRQ